MVKVMLINPPQKFYHKAERWGVYVPIGLLYIAGNIRDICDVSIFDSMVESEEYVDCGNYSIIGATDEMITAAVSEYNPDIIGITVPATIQASCAVNTARICRQVSPDSIIVFGG